MTTDGHAIDLERPGAPVVHADVHLPAGDPMGTVLVAHGFLGYKDYGMLPAITRAISDVGWCGLRFNFGHSGMSRNVATFEYPDRFTESTWSRQVEDLVFLQQSIRQGHVSGADPSRPIVLLGHSRGGTAVILAAGRAFAAEGESTPCPDGLITLAAPADCDRSADDARAAWLESGFTTVVSNRTGQQLRISRGFLDEMDQDSASHDVETLLGHVRCPVLLAHGEADPTIPVTDVDRLAAAAVRSDDLRRLRICRGDHVMNVPNPLAVGDSSPQLDEFLAATVTLLGTIAG
ncbi:MAG: alpha/beta fold hydrolase [Phycisphaerales bacterium]|nr:alpha/beta fold hydrolase [Phycisphaerales bacterium]